MARLEASDDWMPDHRPAPYKTRTWRSAGRACLASRTRSSVTDTEGILCVGSQAVAASARQADRNAIGRESRHDVGPNHRDHQLVLSFVVLSRARASPHDHERDGSRHPRHHDWSGHLLDHVLLGIFLIIFRSALSRLSPTGLPI